MAAPTPQRKQAAAARVVNRVLGADVVAALREGFSRGDLTGVVPLLAAAAANPHLLRAAQEAFVDACVGGEADEVALLLEGDGVDGNAPVDPDYDPAEAESYVEDGVGDTVLGRAARNSHAGVLRALLDSGKADVNRAAPSGERPLLLAMDNADGPECAEALLAADGIDTNAVCGRRDGRTALLCAAEAGNASWIRHCLAVDGVDVNASDKTDGGKIGQTIHPFVAHGGETALIYAASLDVDDVGGATSAECVRALLGAKGINVNSRGWHAQTALWRAAYHGLVDSTRLLLDVDGIFVNCPDTQGIHPLHVATLATARILVSAKHIAIDHPSRRHGQTALHMACSNKDAARAACLLVAGASRSARDRGGSVPLDLAMAAGDKAVLKVFAAGVEYWQRKLHRGHAWAMKEAVRTVLLVRQRLDDHHAPAKPEDLDPAGAVLPHLPVEIWLAALGFLRSADFMTP